MFKNFLILLVFLLLTNCAAPGTALLGPVITGAKTKSAHQASLSLASSLSSNTIMKKHTNEIKDLKKKFFIKTNKVINKINNQ